MTDALVLGFGTLGGRSRFIISDLFQFRIGIQGLRSESIKSKIPDLQAVQVLFFFPFGIIEIKDLGMGNADTVSGLPVFELNGTVERFQYSLFA